MLKCFVAVSYFMVVFLEALSRTNFMPAIIQKTYWHCKVHLNFSEWEYIVKKKGFRVSFPQRFFVSITWTNPESRTSNFSHDEMNWMTLFVTPQLKLERRQTQRGGSSNGECSDHFSLHALIENWKNSETSTKILYC